MKDLKRKRSLLSIILIIVILLFVYFLVPEPGEKETYEVYLAKETITPGTKINSSLFKKGEVLELYPWMITNLDEIQHMDIARLIEKDSFLHINDFTDKNPIYFRIGEGEFTVRARTEYLNGGRVEPGDIVNVIWVERLSDNMKQNGKGETIAKELSVLSVRSQAGTEVNEDTDRNTSPYAVTLKTNQLIAEKLAWYQENGSLSLFVVRKEGK